MEETQDLLLEPLPAQSQVKRRTLLPVWMKVFIWIFMVTGAAAALGPLAALLGARFELSLYGLSDNNPLSAMGALITALFLLKGVVSFGLWTEKRWAVQLGTVDAMLGIIVCTVVMGIALARNNFDFRAELVFLIPYQLLLQKIKVQWLSARFDI